MRLRLASIPLLLVLCGTAQAANVFNITGPDPFGFANQIVLVQAWAQGATYSNVSISMPLADLSSGGPIAGVEGTVYLMNLIGPGATPANEVAPPVTISGLTASFTTTSLFSGLTLPPGNYYMVLVSTSTFSLSMSAEGSSDPVVTPGIAVAAGGGGGTTSAAAYPPATIMTLNPPGNLFIDVQGDLVSLGPVLAIPTLDTFGAALLLLGLAGTALVLLRRHAS
jgi:hypothetical protein